MSDRLLAPDFDLLIEGEPAPAGLRASVTGLSLQNGLEGSDRLEISLVNENLRWLDHPLLQLDKELTLQIGYAPDPLEQVFVGEITGQTATFPSSGMPTLTVVAQDRIQRMQQGSKVRWFAIPVPFVGNIALPDPVTAGIASLENGMIPIFEPVGAALSVLLMGAQSAAAFSGMGSFQKIVRKQIDESDYSFLTRLARENGWEMFVEHRGAQGGHLLRFMSPLDQLNPDVTLKYGRSLIDFTPRLSNVGQVLSISAYIWVAPIKTAFTISVGWDWDRMSLTLEIVPSLIPLGIGPSNFLIEDPVTPVSAPRQIISELIPRLNQRQTASARVVGDARIRAGSVVRIEGVGVEFGGLYRVTNATHSIDSGGYQVSFEMRKEIWLGSIPKPEQGAVPIQVTAPFVG
jgi:hypothetical protein